MHRNGVVGRVGDAVGLVVADDEPWFALQEVQQDMGEARVAVIEHADVPAPRRRLEYGREAVHRNQGLSCRPESRPRASSSIARSDYDRGRIFSRARALVTFGEPDVPWHGRQFTHAQDGCFRRRPAIAVNDEAGVVLPNDKGIERRSDETGESSCAPMSQAM